MHITTTNRILYTDEKNVVWHVIYLVFYYFLSKDILFPNNFPFQNMVIVVIMPKVKRLSPRTIYGVVWSFYKCRTGFYKI